MKFRFIVITLLALLLSACAGSGTKSDLAAHHQVPNHKYIAVVEQKANKNGVEVIWVNPPSRPAPKD